LAHELLTHGGLIAGVLLTAAALVLRLATLNRHIRGRLFASAVAFAVYATAAALVAYGPLTAALRQPIGAFAPMLLVLGLINAGVAVALNPWKSDRVSERFPNIVQDALAIALFAFVAILMLQERILATTAVSVVVVGLALQDTLGNLFAGLAIQIEKPFRVGHWVHIAGRDGMITEITWRATKIHTKTGNFVVIPNSALAKDTIINYSEPHRATCLEIDVGASYDATPSDVKTTILDALGRDPILTHDRPPQVLVVDFAPSAVTYRIRVWTDDFALYEMVTDRVRSLVYYAFRRRGITIPYPVQVQIAQEAGAAVRRLDDSAVRAALDAVDIFKSLGSDQRVGLVAAARPVVYSADEIIVRQGDPGSSMFVVVEGEARVTLDGEGLEVARFAGSGFFGEMSLLTGEPRTATVTAVTDCTLLEITAEAFRRFVLANPSALEDVTQATAARAVELVQVRVSSSPPRAPEAPASFLGRVRKFLRL
jgi:small-conductance mechanosensitive channel